MTPTEQAADRLKASLARNPHMLKEEPGQDLLAVLNALTALQARVGELEGALKPFAALAQAFKEGDDRKGLAFTTPNLSPSDFLKARALLTPPLEQE